MAGRVPRHTSVVRQSPANVTVYLRKATDLAQKRDYPSAYQYFIKYFESLDNPNKAPLSVQKIFTNVICEIGTALEATNNIEELLKCYLQAINFFPNNYMILNNLGGYMYRVGELEIARRYLEAAVKANPKFLPAEKNLLYVKWHQLPRWHFRMLNDLRRNVAYVRAIDELLEEGFTNVVDLGAGCGLLSLIAASNPKANVTAIEENKLLYKMCSEILKENEATNVRLLHCNSTELKSAPAPCNLLVTEIFDVALFGERALETLTHALRTLVTYPKYRVIPARAQLYVTGIYSGYIGCRTTVVTPLPQLNILKSKICIRQSDSEPYEAEYLNNPAIALKYQTDTALFASIDFSNCNQLEKIVKGEKQFDIQLKCVNDGWVHSLAVWFDLDLTQEVRITTDPRNKKCVNCWEQAVFHLERPILMNKGEKLHLRASAAESRLKFEVVNKNVRFEEYVNVHDASGDIVTFLNDAALVQAICNVADTFKEATDLKVIDLNCFPLFGFLMAKKGSYVYHVYQNVDDLPLFREVMRLNDIPSDRVIFVDSSQNCARYAASCNVLFYDGVNTDGSLAKTGGGLVTPLLKSGLEGGTLPRCIPKAIHIRVQLIASPDIDNWNKVNSDNCLGYKIDKFMNEYTGSEHPNIFNMRAALLSRTIALKSNPIYFESVIQVPVVAKGFLNGVHFWYDIVFTPEITVPTYKSLYHRKSCAILENPRVVEPGQIVKLYIKREDNYLKISIVDD